MRQNELVERHERRVICAIADDNAVLDSLTLAEADMLGFKAKVALRCATELRHAGKAFDILTLADACERVATGQMQEWLMQSQVEHMGVSLVGAEESAAAIRDESRKRTLLASLKEIIAKHDSLAFEEMQDRVGSTLIESDRAPRTAKSIAKVLFDRITELESHGDVTAATGFPTGVEELDAMLGGVQPGIVTVFAGRPAMGKAQPLDAKVLTPTGWRFMGELSVGDEVISADGFATKVVAVHERGKLQCYRVSTNDGGSTVCCGDHLWATHTRNERKRGAAACVRSTLEIANTINRAGGGANHSIPHMLAAEFAAQPVPAIDPYLLGLYLGDGHSKGCVYLTNPEPDIRAAFLERLHPDDVGVLVDSLHIRVKRRNESRTKDGHLLPSLFMCSLRSLRLDGCRSHEKFIPKEYLLGSREVRLAILRGLFDSDGYVTTKRLVEYSTTSPRLRDDVRFLVGSLGGSTSCAEHEGQYTKDGERHQSMTAWRILARFPTGDVVPVSSVKHSARWGGGAQRTPVRYIKSVEPVGVVECRCITVENPNGLYVTDDFLVTHNSSICLSIAKACAEQGIGVHAFTLEDSISSYADRTISRYAQIETQKVRRGGITRAALDSIKPACRNASSWIVDADEPEGPEQIIRSVRARAKKNGTRVVIVDYLQVVANCVKMDERDAIRHCMQMFMLAAKRDNIAYVVLSQLNRQSETRADRRPSLADMHGSGSIEQFAKCVIGLYRPGYYITNDAEYANAYAIAQSKAIATGTTNTLMPLEQAKRTIELIILKNNNGSTGSAFGNWKGEFCEIT